MNPPIYKTPAFWRGLAAEWRGPLTDATRRGICLQIIEHTQLSLQIAHAAICFLYKFDPNQDAKCYFFPIGDRASRATLCEKIATHLENEANQATAAQTAAN